MSKRQRDGKLSEMIMIKKIGFTSKPYTPFVLCLMLYGIVALFLAPSCLSADEVVTTYDPKTIRYPSMFVGQIWAKSTEPASSDQGKNEGRKQTLSSEGLSSNSKTNPESAGTPTGKKTSPALAKEAPVVKTDADIQKRLKEKRLKTIRKLDAGKTQKTALTSPLSTPASRKVTPKTAVSKKAQPKKTVSSGSKSYLTAQTSRSERNWHHKQELYDVECSRRLARIVVTYYFDRENNLLGSTVSSDAPWYHIYPGSLEEKLYVELCHPSVH